MSENRYLGAVVAALAIAMTCACQFGTPVRVMNDGPEAVRVVVADPLDVPKFDDSWVEVPAGGEAEVSMYFHYWQYNGRQRLLVSKDGNVLSVYEVAFYGHQPYSLFSEPYFVVSPAPVRISPETSLAWHDLKITNNLTKKVHIVRDNLPLGVVVEPESTKKLWSVIPLKPDGQVRLMGANTFAPWWERGALLYDATFTIDELEAMDWHLVME